MGGDSLLPQDGVVAMDDSRMPVYKPVVEADQPKAPDKLEVGAQLHQRGLGSAT
jgi:hypothetical protein